VIDQVSRDLQGSPDRFDYEWDAYAEMLPEYEEHRLPIALIHHRLLYPTALLCLAFRLGPRPIEYFRLLARFRFAHLRSIPFDQMLPRIAHYWPRETVPAPMAEAEDIRIALVNKMSWSAIGTRPLRPVN
jgi:hypothetical protein